MKIGLHMGVAKTFLLAVVRERGARFVLGNVPDGMSDAEAIKAIEADTREVFTGPECDNQGPDGRCRGHNTAPDRLLYTAPETAPTETVECAACGGDGSGTDPNLRSGGPCRECHGTGRAEVPYRGRR